MNEREALIAFYREALRSVHAGDAVTRALPEALGSRERVVVLAVGKAAVAMARAAVGVLGDRIAGGAVCAPEFPAGPIGPLTTWAGGHPLPDAGSVRAAEHALDLAAGTPADHVLLVLLSGGASALWCAPAAGLSLEDKRRASELLLRSGAEIGELNAVRKHLSRIKAGRLARVSGTRRIVTLAISDVRGDAADAIGSGPTAADSTSFGDALEVLERHDLPSAMPTAVLEHLRAGARGAREEGARDAELGATRFRVIASLQIALESAATAARAAGLPVVQLGPCLYGEVSALAAALAERVRAERDALILAGGEPSVRVRGPGRGGRCQELAVRLALELESERGWAALCAGSDGFDGSTDVAGAVVDPMSLARMRAAGRDPRAGLEQSDSYDLLAASGDHLRTGPTDTNVADLVLIRVRR